VSRATNWLTDESVAVKYSMPQISAGILQYEARIYEQLSGSRAIPSLHWSGSDGGADVLVMDLLGPTLDHMQCACRGSFTIKSVLMIGLQILDFVEFAHSRGIILRDIKPHNFAVGHALTPDSAGTIYAFDFGLAKMYVDPLRKTHIPLRTGREICGTIRYSSHWSHLGLEASRRDDIVGLGHTLLNLLHGRLPWQGFYAASVEAKLARIGEMKAPSNAVLMEFLSRSPTALRDFMTHGYSLDFEQKPDYELLRGLLEAALRENGWVNDGMFDWMEPSLAPRGTVLLSEYKYILDPDVVPATMRPLSDRINKFPPEFRDQIR
ncbi:kinase-like protein, partial [Fistulina hepatica ATCC 64428]